MKKTFDIEYLDEQSSTFPLESWKPATLVLDADTLKVMDMEKQIVDYRFDGIYAANLLSMTGGEPARLTLMSKSDTKTISIRPKRRYLRLIKQANDLRDLGELLNEHAGRSIINLNQIKNLRFITMVGLTVFVAVISVSFFQILKSLVSN